MKRQYRGFTLIELMITVVIIGILAAISYPSYTRYVTQSRRSDGEIALQQTANRLEKFMTFCNTYTTDTTNAWPDTCPPVPANKGLGLTGRSPESHYAITVTGDNAGGTCTAAGGPCNGLAGSNLTTCQLQCGYVIVANPAAGGGVTGRQASDGRMRLDSRGLKWRDKNNDGDFNDAGEDSWK